MTPTRGRRSFPRSSVCKASPPASAEGAELAAAHVVPAPARPALSPALAMQAPAHARAAHPALTRAAPDSPDHPADPPALEALEAALVVAAAETSSCSRRETPSTIQPIWKTTTPCSS